MSRKVGGNVVSRIKIGSLVLGIVILGLGLYSYFTSAWIKKYTIEGDELQFYKICNDLKELAEEEDFLKYYDHYCPNILLERYFVGAVIACFALSLILFAAGIAKDMRSGKLMIVDVSFHVLGGLALIAAGICYLVSALQIFFWFDDAELGMEKFHFRNTEKRLAASLTIFQGVFFLTIASLIVRNAPRGNTSVMTHGVVAQPITAQPNYGYGVAAAQPYTQQQTVAYAVAPPSYPQSMNHGTYPTSQYPQNVNYGFAGASAQSAPTPTYGFPTYSPDYLDYLATGKQARVVSGF